MLRNGTILMLILGLCVGDNINGLKEGDLAPDFVLPDHDGKLQRLSDYRGQRVVVYFYPKADTPGWTKEACSLRDHFKGFKKENIKVFGISYDSVDSQKKFRDKYNLPFILLSDSKHKVGKLYGVDKGRWTERKTFIIDQEGKIMKIYDKVSVTTHGKDILYFLSSDKPEPAEK